MTIRVPLVEPGTRPELAGIEASIMAQRGRISDLYRVLLNSGPLAKGWEGMLTAVRNQSSVPANLRELMILRVAVVNRAPYEFDAHVPHAQAGVAVAQPQFGRVEVGVGQGLLVRPGPALGVEQRMAQQGHAGFGIDQQLEFAFHRPSPGSAKPIVVGPL